MIHLITNKIISWFYDKIKKPENVENKKCIIEIVNNITIELLAPSDNQRDRARVIYECFIKIKSQLESEVDATPFKPLSKYADADITLEEAIGSKFHVTYDWDDYFVSMEIENDKIVDIYGGD